MSTSRIIRLARTLGFAAAVGSCALLAGSASTAHAATATAVYGAPVSAALTPKQRLAIATFKKAKMRYDAGDYAGALPLFQQADQLHPGGAPKYKIAECLDKLGRNAEAVAAYKAFIDSNPGAKYQDRIVSAGQRIAQLQASLPAKAKLVVTPPGLAYTVTVDGVAAQGPELTLQPGQHTIEVTAPNHMPARQQITAAGGQETTVTLALQPGGAVGPRPQPRKKGNPGLPFIIAGLAAGGVALGAGVVTTVFGVQALGKKSEFDDGTAGADNITPDQANQLADDAESKALISDVFLGVAGGFAVGAGVLLVIGLTAGGKEQSGAVPQITPHVGTNGGGATVTWSF